MDSKITARIYDTDGTEWSDLPALYAGESLGDYAFRLYQWARIEILRSASYGDVERLVDVEHPHEASVVVYVETEDEWVDYCILARQTSYEATDAQWREAIDSTHERDR